ncbi:MAG: hypothetical protein L0Y68_09450 [Candidatus Dadabacteria bacterium]|nr:hypothetical protein [Candidatus Dadabacteria bacterium]
MTSCKIKEWRPYVIVETRHGVSLHYEKGENIKGGLSVFEKQRGKTI